MPTAESELFNYVLNELSTFGLLLESDAALPSVAGLIAGEPVRGSWWSHPKSHTIFNISERLADHPDVLFTKLILGKITLVHRRLWPAIYAVATAREDWQTRKLTDLARATLRLVDRQSRIDAGNIRASLKAEAKPLSDAIRDLERTLLVHTESVHTDKGRHEKIVESWHSWNERAAVVNTGLSASDGRALLNEAVLTLGERAANGLPWLDGDKARSRR